MPEVGKYLQNCFLLTLPVMVWNVLLTDHLPEPFQPHVWDDIPAVLGSAEQASRVIMLLFTVIMPLRIHSSVQKMGVFVYLTGVVVYFASWSALILFPDARWSTSIFGFMAPAYTPLLWLIGIALIGTNFYFGFRYARWLFMVASLVFLVAHNLHAWLIYQRIYG